jgi:hypothetical protein
MNSLLWMQEGEAIFGRLKDRQRTLSQTYSDEKLTIIYIDPTMADKPDSIL